MIGKRRVRALTLLGALGLTPLLLACEEQSTYVPPPAPQVTVAQPLVQDVTEYLEFTGTTVAYARAEVPARVPGVLKSLHFEPGVPVNAGDPLFTIDPVEYAAQVQAAEAELARAEARRTETSKTLERAETLIKRGNISQAKVDEAQADFLSAKAEVLVRQANLTQARINLGYTEVTAPITGRVGRNLVDVGNLVGQGEATILTDITTYDPMYVYFDVNERDLLRYMTRNRQVAPDDSPAGRREAMPIEVGLANEDGFPHRGVTDFAESQVDPDTGTIRVRGIVPNPGREPVFLPGLFVRVRLPFETRPDVPLVTERAIGFDQGGQYVLVANAENVVERRGVTLGTLFDGLRVITSGVGPDDRVVVKGLQRAREGIAVQAEEIDMARLTASAIEADETADDGGRPEEGLTDDDGASLDNGTPVGSGPAEAAAPSLDAAAPAPAQD